MGEAKAEAVARRLDRADLHDAELSLGRLALPPRAGPRVEGSGIGGRDVRFAVHRLCAEEGLRLAVCELRAVLGAEDLTCPIRTGTASSVF